MYVARRNRTQVTVLVVTAPVVAYKSSDWALRLARLARPLHMLLFAVQTKTHQSIPDTRDTFFAIYISVPTGCYCSNRTSVYRLKKIAKAMVLLYARRECFTTVYARHTRTKE